MKAAIYFKPGVIALEDVQIPAISSQDVFIRVKVTGICGTDRHIFKGDAPAALKIALGHELSGEITEIGESVEGFAVGDRVVVDPNIFCGKCFYCRRGEVNLCENLEAVGVTQNGGFAEYVAVPASNVYKLPESLSFAEGAMAEPVSCCLRGIDQADISPGDIIMVLGGGAIGLILAQLARAAGAAEVFISDPKEYNRNLAHDLDFTEVYSPKLIKEKLEQRAPQGADIVFEAVGSTVTTKECFKLVRRGGTIILFGVAPEYALAELAPFDIYKNELTIKGSYINPFVTERALNILGSRKINVKPLITDEYPLTKLVELLTEPVGENSIKTIITFE